jgi:outer membrane biosynthesis protein TonB
MLENHVKFLATFYTSILMAGLVSVLLLGGFEFDSPVVPGRVIQAQMIDISQIKRTQKQPIKKEVVTPKPPVKKEPAPVEKEAVKPPVKKEEITPPIKKEPAIIPTKPKEDTKKLEEERKKEEDRKKKLEELREKRLEAEKRAKQEEENLKNLAEQIKQEQLDDQPIIVSNQEGPSEYDKLQQLMALYQSSVIS